MSVGTLLPRLSLPLTPVGDTSGVWMSGQIRVHDRNTKGWLSGIGFGRAWVGMGWIWVWMGDGATCDDFMNLDEVTLAISAWLLW